MPNCDYGASHTFSGLLAHVRRLHKEIYANYVKGREIPWNGVAPVLSDTESAVEIQETSARTGVERPRLALAPKSANILPSDQSESSSKRQKLMVSLDESEDVVNHENVEEERKFAVEDLLQAGFTKQIMQHITDFNNWMQSSNSGLSIHTPEPTKRISEKYVVGGVRKCTSSEKDGDCAYGVAITISTAQLQVKKLASGKVLQFTTRCFLCIKAANLKDFKLRLAKEKDGVLLCSQTAKCQNPRLPGRLQCRDCEDAWTATWIKREINTRTEEMKPKFGPGSTVKDPSSMAQCIETLWIGPSLGAEWNRFFDQVCTRPQDVFAIDTETGFDGTVHEVGIINLDGLIVVDNLVNHGCSLADFYRLSESGLSEAQQFRAFFAVNKSYGPPSNSPMPGLTPGELVQRFQQAGMSASSIWVEHSFGNFDYRKLKELTPPDMTHVLPRESNVFSTLTLWRLLLPGLFSHKQSHRFSLLCPDQAAVSGKRHNALPDAIMCREILKVAIERFNATMPGSD